ncbi:MAG: hypothetical protein RLZZ598_1119 [Pseudomonadota bacterium]|jgi:hypothetical protein
MLMLYNSDQFAVVQIDVDADDPTRDAPGDGLALAVPSGPLEPALRRGGYEIVDKLAGRQLFLEGAMAQEFKLSVEALAETSPSTDEIDAWLGRYRPLAQQPVILH